MEDQSQTTRRIWRSRVRIAIRSGYSLGAEFRGVPGGHEAGKNQRRHGSGQCARYDSALLPEATQTLLHGAVVVRLAGREDAHVKNVCLVPKKGDISWLSHWEPISFVPTLYKLYELCMWEVLDKEFKPLPDQLFGFRPGVSFLVEGLRKAKEWGEQLFVISMDVASAFDTVTAEILGDALLAKSVLAISAAAVVREQFQPALSAVLGPHAKCSVQSGCESRQGGSGTPSGWNQLVAVFVEELVKWRANRNLAVGCAPEWKAFEILVFFDNIFLVTSSASEAKRRTQEVASISRNKNSSSTRIARKSCRVVRRRSAWLPPFYSTGGSSVLLGSVCWTPTVNAQQLVAVQQNRWLRCILGGKNNDPEWLVGVVA